MKKKVIVAEDERAAVFQAEMSKQYVQNAIERLQR